jgi:hypothetical protein
MQFALNKIYEGNIHIKKDKYHIFSWWIKMCSSPTSLICHGVVSLKINHYHKKNLMSTLVAHVA